MRTFKTISVIGLGYIGLPTAAAFANAGCKVFGVDADPAVVERVNRGEAHIIEPELAAAVRQAVENGKLFAKKRPVPAEAYLIAVPTPLGADRQPDLGYVEAAAEAIAPCLSAGNLVVLESTSPVGTTERLECLFKRLRPDLRFPSDMNGDRAHKRGTVHIAYCPERVLPGRVMSELFDNDRVIGGLSPQCAQQAVDLYRIFTKGECLPTNARTAEMCKLAENSFRDVNIAFANELSMVCDENGVNVWELIALANRHPRVNILQPGAGVGGHCIAVDPWFIVAQAPERARLIRTAREVNDSKPLWVLDKVKAALADCIQAENRKPTELTVACLGLAFKPDVGDLRGSPALQITAEIAEWHRGEVLAVEPNIRRLPQRLAGKVQLVDLERALLRADVLVLLVDHAPFKTFPVDKIPSRRIVDTRGVWAKSDFYSAISG